MGGDRETIVKQATTSGKVIGGLRIHENMGEVHFHDDDAKLKVAIPTAEWFLAWQQISSGKQKKYAYLDNNNKTRLRVCLKSKNKIADILLTVERVNFSDAFNAMKTFSEG